MLIYKKYILEVFMTPSKRVVIDLNNPDELEEYIKNSSIHKTKSNFFDKAKRVLMLLESNYSDSNGIITIIDKDGNKEKIL